MTNIQCGKDAKHEKRLKVLINPFGGQGLARKIFREKVAPVFESASCKVDVQGESSFNARFSSVDILTCLFG